MVASYYFWMRRRGATSILLFARDDAWRYLFLVMLAGVSLALALVFAIDAAASVPEHLVMGVLVYRTAIYTVVLFVPMLIIASLLCYALRREA